MHNYIILYICAIHNWCITMYQMSEAREYAMIQHKRYKLQPGLGNRILPIYCCLGIQYIAISQYSLEGAIPTLVDTIYGSPTLIHNESKYQIPYQYICHILEKEAFNIYPYIGSWELGVLLL